jgi:multiple sugar transport system permease protein
MNAQTFFLYLLAWVGISALLGGITAALYRRQGEKIGEGFFMGSVFAFIGSVILAIPFWIFTLRKANLGKNQTQRIWGWFFISPWIVGFTVFYFFPIIASFIFTFLSFNLNEPDSIKFIGLDNYEQLLRDGNVRTSLLVTARYAFFALPLSIILPLAMASLLNAKSLWGKRFFRTLFYLPYMVPLISVIYIFNGFLNAESGWLNRFLETYLGIAEPPNWLNSITWIYGALVIIGFWGVGNAMLTMLASMQTVPTELYEAAKVDGAGPVTRFRVITLPMISPVIFYNLVLALIGLFRYFDIPYILSRGLGTPGESQLFYNLYFYRQTFRLYDMGYGATLAWLLFVVAMLATATLFASSRYWVYYAGDRD